MNQLVQYQVELDRTFAALSDSTRRAILLRLGRSEAAVGELAAGFDMTLTGVKKHVLVLEEAGLVTTEKVGRVRTCRLGRGALADEAAWIERLRELWAARFAALDAVVEDLKRRETDDGRSRR